MSLLNNYFDIQNQIYKYFGYEETWRTLPVFKDVLITYVFVCADKADVYFKYGGHRAKNRIKAYSERYEELRAVLDGVTVQITT